MTPAVDPYAVLGVAHDATGEEIRTAYLALARRTHPDVRAGNSAATDQMQRVNLAYQTLIDSQARAALDAQIARRSHPVAAPKATNPTPPSQPTEDSTTTTADEPDARIWDLADQDFSGDDRAITTGELPTWMRLGAPAAFVLGIFEMIFGLMIGAFGLVQLGLATLVLSGLGFLLAPFVVLVRSRR